MKSDFNKILENIINNNLYSFLRSHSADGLIKKCEEMRLGEDQVSFLKKLFPLALSESELEFSKYLEAETKINPGIFPIEIDPDSLHSLDPEPYAKILRGKRVVLVGPSASIIGKKQGELIESYDLIVRINFQWPIPKDKIQDLGERMDILYHCCNGDCLGSFVSEDFGQTKFVCYERNFESRVLKRFCDKHNVGSMDVSSVYKDLENKLGVLPNTGTVAICHLMQFDIAELFITGLTFFQERYYEGYQGKGANDGIWEKGEQLNIIRGHQVGPQIEHCRNLISRDPRVRVDEKLNEVFERSAR